MKIRVLLAMVCAFLGLLVLSPKAKAAGLLIPEPENGAALCKPGVRGDCLEAGPSRYLSRMAEKGIHLPVEPLQAQKPDPQLAQVPYLYGQVVTPNAPVFATAEDAARGKPVLYRMETGFSYISYTYTEVVDGVRVYMIAPGVWMNAFDVHRIGVSSFQGLVFERTPRTPFGWILQPVETKRTPGYAALDYTGETLNRFEIVQIYQIESVGEVEWYMVRPGQWIEQRMISAVFPRETPPPGVVGERWIEVNLFEQTVTVYEDGRLRFATVISSGVEPFWTRPGLFQIYQKLESTPMSGSFEADRSDYYYLEDVPWTMYFDQARALHGAYWHTGYGYPRSHGCVNMSVGDARWLFEWAQEGDWVYVYDPSGNTPTDPSLYTAGGA